MTKLTPDDIKFIQQTIRAEEGYGPDGNRDLIAVLKNVLDHIAEVEAERDALALDLDAMRQRIQKREIS